MFDTLLESRPPRERRLGGRFASVVLHGALVGGAVLGTREVATPATPIVHETITYVAPPVMASAPPAAAAAAPTPTAAPTLAVPLPVIVAPINIPNVLPRIDVTAAEVAAVGAAFRVPGSVPCRAAEPCTRHPAPGIADSVYGEISVDRPAKALTGYGVPEYPELLRHAGVSGSVRVSFVIDTMGRGDVGTLTVIESSRPQFAESVKKALPSMRFLPAELRGRKVKQLVVMPFTFEIK